MPHRLLPRLTSSFTSPFPHTAEGPRTEKQSKAQMAEDRIFILKMVVRWTSRCLMRFVFVALCRIKYWLENRLEMAATSV
jgi:hypothetical protein